MASFARGWLLGSALGLVLALAFAPAALAQAPTPPAAPGAPTTPDPSLAPQASVAQRIAVWRFDALGIEPELVVRLEALFRSEIDRLVSRPTTSRREIDRKIGGELAQCTGEERCLAAIGKRLEVDLVVSGSVGSLGDNYLLDIKVVEVAGARQLRRITTEPLRGTPDDLIDAVRVAAYRLLAPEQVHGSIAVLSDLVGAEVSVDGKRVGTTPLPTPVTRLSPGPHALRVVARGYAPFEESIEVRFQKTTRVEVRLVADASAPAPAPQVVLPPRRPWYTRGWALAAFGTIAVVAGVLVGYELGHVERTCVNCDVVGVGGRW